MVSVPSHVPRERNDLAMDANTPDQVRQPIGRSKNVEEALVDASERGGDRNLRQEPSNREQSDGSTDPSDACGGRPLFVKRNDLPAQAARPAADRRYGMARIEHEDL